MAEKDPTAIKALNEVEKGLNCTICLDLFTEPKILPCLHAFCKKCLSDLALLPREGGSVLSCPICRSHFPLPEDGVSGFPSAFHLNDLLELRQQVKKLSEAKSIMCESCKKLDTTGFCQQCGKFICEKCTEAHLQISALMPGHDIIGLKEVISTISQLIPVKQQPIMECPTHKKPLDIYCESCAVLVCHHCTIRQHRGHEYEPITDDSVFQKHLQQIRKLIPPAKKKLAFVKEAFQALIKRSEEVVSSKERTKKEIDNTGQQLIAEYTAAVQECVQNLKEELEEGAKEKLGFLSSHREAAETAATLLESCLDYVEQLVKIGSKQQILANKVQMVNRIGLVMSQVNVESLSPAEEADFGFDADKQATELPRTIGRVSFSTLARRCTVTGKGVNIAMANKVNSFCFQLAIKPLSTSVVPSFPVSVVSCQLTPLSGTCPSDCEVKDTSGGIYKVSYIPSSRGPHQLRVFVGGTEVAGSPFTVSVSPSPVMRCSPV